MAESIFRHKVQQAGLEDVFHIDSAGTGNWHVGQNPDPRTIKVLIQQGITQYSRARQVKSSDFEEFTYVVAMDSANLRDLHEWRGSQPDRVSLMLTWDSTSRISEVPDPYYGDSKDFEVVYRLLDKALTDLLDQLCEIHHLNRTQ